MPVFYNKFEVKYCKKNNLMIIYQHISGLVDKEKVRMEESLGKYLVILRKEKLNIEVSRQMAKKLEITPQYMHDIENDNRIPSKKV